jgi:hypothetical protein
LRSSVALNRTLRPFEAAARLESFSPAADEISVTHGAVSHQIRSLERRIVTGKLPASAAEQLYALRQHIHFVRNRLLQEQAAR